MRDADRRLWTVRRSETEVSCWLIGCCAGAELRLVRNGEVHLQELYPDRSTLYERALELRRQWTADGYLEA